MVAFRSAKECPSPGPRARLSRKRESTGLLPRVSHLRSRDDVLLERVN